MKRQKIAGIFADASSFGGQELTVCGWVRTVRDMKNFGFIELNDGSCFKSLQYLHITINYMKIWRSWYIAQPSLMVFSLFKPPEKEKQVTF